MDDNWRYSHFSKPTLWCSSVTGDACGVSHSNRHVPQFSCQKPDISSDVTKQHRKTQKKWNWNPCVLLLNILNLLFSQMLRPQKPPKIKGFWLTTEAQGDERRPLEPRGFARRWYRFRAYDGCVSKGGTADLSGRRFWWVNMRSSSIKSRLPIVCQMKIIVHTTGSMGSRLWDIMGYLII